MHTAPRSPIANPVAISPNRILRSVVAELLSCSIIEENRESRGEYPCAHGKTTPILTEERRKTLDKVIGQRASFRYRLSFLTRGFST
jgi:hypothetical protein